MIALTAAKAIKFYLFYIKLKKNVWHLDDYVTYTYYMCTYICTSNML